MSTLMKTSQRDRCKNLMIEVVEDLVKGHSKEIIDAVNELYENSGDERKAGLNIPVILKVRRQVDIGYTFSGKIDIRKVECITDERDPVTYNPDLPDLPGFEDGKVPAQKQPEKNNAETEQASKGKKETAAEDNQSGTENQENAGKNEKKTGKDEKSTPVSEKNDENLKTGDCGNVFRWLEREAEIVDFEEIKSQITPEIKDKFIAYGKNSKTGNPTAFFEMQLLDLDPDKIPDGDLQVIRGNADGLSCYYLLPGGGLASPQSENSVHSEPELCGAPHADGVRVCQKPKGHEGRHSYGAKPENTGIKPENAAPGNNKALNGTNTEPADTDIVKFLAENDIALADAEMVLRSAGKLMYSKELKDYPPACKYVRENIETIKDAVAELKKSA